MKEYIKPEFEIVSFQTEDVTTTTSGLFEPSINSLQTSINGKEGTNYGSQEVSVFE